MFKITNSAHIEELVKLNIFDKNFIDILSNDLFFLLEDLNTLDISKFYLLIAIPPKSNISELIINGIDIINSCSISNICYFNNNIIKASVIIDKCYCISVYFHNFSNPYLTSWIYKEKKEI